MSVLRLGNWRLKSVLNTFYTLLKWWTNWNYSVLKTCWLVLLTSVRREINAMEFILKFACWNNLEINHFKYWCTQDRSTPRVFNWTESALKAYWVSFKLSTLLKTYLISVNLLNPEPSWHTFFFFRYFAVTSPILYSQHRHSHTPAYTVIVLCWASSLAIGQQDNNFFIFFIWIFWKLNLN